MPGTRILSFFILTYEELEFQGPQLLRRACSLPSQKCSFHSHPSLHKHHHSHHCLQHKMFVPPPIPTVCEKCLSPVDKQIVCLPSTPVTVKCLFPEDKQMGGRKTSHTYTLTDKCFIHIDMAKKAVYIADTYQFKTKRIDLRRHPASICYCV